ncbi:MAG: hypothetical protein NHB15_00350 [Methanosarcina barkeri]|nr:hypothetical protein [Methanosarcina sp. ERenArc_MAG2]
MVYGVSGLLAIYLHKRRQ